MFTSSIEGIAIPVIIARRAKGHTDVIADFATSVKVLVDPIVFVKYFSPYAKQVFTLSDLSGLALAIKDGEKLSKVELRAKFSLPIERQSPTFVGTTLNVPCEYRAVRSSTQSFCEMGLRVPVHLQDVFLQVGSIDFFVRQPVSYLYFEDLWDHVLRQVSFALYPATSALDRKKILEMNVDKRTAMEMLGALQQGSVHANLGEGGRIGVTFSDVYSMYNFTHTLNW